MTNSGKRAGAEVAQIYIGDSSSAVPRPSKELKGFVKVNLEPGETKHLIVPLDTRSFAYYDTNSATWRAAAGTYKILIGKSSEEIELTGEIRLSRTITERP